MTQHTPTIGTGQSGIDYRTQDNDGKKALLNHHKGAAAPTYAEAGIIWLDDAATPWVLKVHDGADWIKLGDINASDNSFSAYHGTALPRLINHAADTGAADAYAVAPAPVITAYATGQVVTLKPVNANTGAATINVNSLGVKNIKLLDGSNPAAGALSTTGVYTLVFDGTHFVLLNPSLGSAAYMNAGTSSNNLVQLDGTAKLPAVDGSQLTNLPAGAPAGGVMPYAGATEPSGWLFCYGQAIGRTTYAALFTAIGTVHGVGDGSTTFNVPDIRGRVVAGKDNMGGTSANRLTNQSGGLDGDALGAAGGAETHTLTTAQMPAHTHTVSLSGSGSTTPREAGLGRPDDLAATQTSSSTGGGSAHNNVQPTIILNYIIKT